MPTATRAAPVNVAKSIIISGLSFDASVRASESIRRPSASVLPTSTVIPFLVWRTSRGRKASPEIAFSTAGIKTLSLMESPASIIIWANPRTWAAPPISFFIFSIPDAGLISSPPLSKQTPLPTRVIFGEDLFPHCKSIKQGAREEARPTA